MNNWQTPVALLVVAVTAAALLYGAWRKRRSGSGCSAEGEGCGCSALKKKRRK